jgi:hypothetical protein
VRASSYTLTQTGSIRSMAWLRKQDLARDGSASPAKFDVYGLLNTASGGRDGRLVWRDAGVDFPTTLGFFEGSRGKRSKLVGGLEIPKLLVQALRKDLAIKALCDASLIARISEVHPRAAVEEAFREALEPLEAEQAEGAQALHGLFGRVAIVRYARFMTDEGSELLFSVIDLTMAAKGCDYDAAKKIVHRLLDETRPKYRKIIFPGQVGRPTPCLAVDKAVEFLRLIRGREISASVRREAAQTPVQIAGGDASLTTRQGLRLRRGQGDCSTLGERLTTFGDPFKILTCRQSRRSSSKKNNIARQGKRLCSIACAHVGCARQAFRTSSSSSGPSSSPEAAAPHPRRLCRLHGGGPRCKSQACSVYSTAPPADYMLRTLCWGCFVALHPGISKSKVRREQLVLAELDRRIPALSQRAIEQVQDCRIPGGCSLKRPDMLYVFSDRYVQIEVDEQGHGSYQCSDEDTRLEIIAADVGVPGLVLRIDPDRNGCVRKRRRRNGELVWEGDGLQFPRLMSEACGVVEDFMRLMPAPPEILKRYVA